MIPMKRRKLNGCACLGRERTLLMSPVESTTDPITSSSPLPLPRLHNIRLDKARWL